MLAANRVVDIGGISDNENSVRFANLVIFMKNKKVIKGRWKDIRVSEKSREIEASYDRIKDFEMDPRGYFLIKVDSDVNRVRVGFCSHSENVMQEETIGKTALEIINTLIKENLVSTLQHAGDLGIEIYKAELALRHGLEYTQDGELSVV